MPGRSDSTDDPPTPERRIVSWVARPDRESDRLRLAVYHLGAGVAGTFVCCFVALLVLLALRSLLGPDPDLFVLVVTLMLVGGPGSLLYLLLAAEVGSERERERFLSRVRWIRPRYLLLALPGGVVGLALVAVQPALLVAFPFAFVAVAAAVEGRYSVGRLDPTTATLRIVTGADAVADYADDPARLDGEDERPVRTDDLSPLRRVHRYPVGNYSVFVARYRRRGWWGRPRLLVVPTEAAGRVEGALNDVVRTSEWDPGDGMAQSVRIALGGLGLFFLGAAGGLTVLAGAGSEAVRSLAVFPAGLGAIMVAVAVRG